MELSSPLKKGMKREREREEGKRFHEAVRPTKVGDW